MRKSLTILFLSFSLIASATNYYVATPASGGNDANPGTFAQPWASWEEAFTSTDVNPGDTVFIRGGVYYTTVVTGQGIGMTRNGTADNWIVYINYPGEKPIMDFGNITADDILYPGARNDGIRTNGVNYVKLIGVTVRNVKQYFNRNYARGIYLRNGIVSIENCTAYNCWGHGFHMEHNTDDGGNIHYIINCDSYNNCDSLSGDPLGSNAGATGAGFDAWFGITSGKTYLINCRAWGNSDQGFALPCEGYIKCEGCWSFANRAYVNGGGAGFKMGWQNIDVPDLRREMINCVATFNDGFGFLTNEKGSGDAPDWNAIRSNHFNNIAYHNGFGSNDFNYLIQDTQQADTIEQWRNFSNNIDYVSARGYTYLAGGTAEYSGSNNSWDIPLTLTDADFVSLDTTGITAPRQADGSLPDNDCYNKFLHLADASQAINRGIDVGLPYSGDAPDLGPFEWDDYDAPPPLIATSYPTIITSKRIVAGGFIIEDYDESIVWKGVCWNTTGNPSDEDDRISGGTGSDPYTVTISGLTANTTYYIRAYAITESGTGYGNTYEITTDKRTQLTLNGKPVVRGGVIQYIE